MRRSILLAVCCFLLSFNTLKAQNTFLHYYSAGVGVVPSCMDKTPDGGYIIGATLDSSLDDEHIMFIKTDSNGNEQWRVVDTTVGYNQVHHVLANPDGSFYFCGEYGGYGCWGKRNDLGELLWFRLYGDSAYGADCNSIISTNDQNLLIVGSTSERGGLNILVLKLDTVGNIIWKVVYGDSSSTDEAIDVKEFIDSSYIVTGTFANDPPIFDTTNQAYLLKLGTHGDTLWFKKYGGVIGRSINILPNGDLALTGEAAAMGQNQAYILLTNDTGEVLNELAFGDPPNDAYIVKSYPVGNNIYLLEGTTDSIGINFSLKKYDLVTDSVILLRHYGWPYEQQAEDMLVANDKSITALFNESDMSCLCAGLIKTDSLGCIPELCTTGIDELGVETLRIYPNPFEDILNIEADNYAGDNETDIRIYDLSGRVVQQGVYHGSDIMQMHLSGLAPGCYLLEFFTNNKILKTKIMKMN